MTVIWSKNSFKVLDWRVKKKKRVKSTEDSRTGNDLVQEKDPENFWLEEELARSLS